MARGRRILALDAAGSACSAAIWSVDHIVARRFEIMRRGQSEHLVPMIQGVMADAGLDFPSLDGLAVTCGPGGFTGVRIGLATARGLALACGLPLLGISNLEAVAGAVPPAERLGHHVVVMLDAKRPELYLQVFAEDLTPMTEPVCADPAALDDLLPAGSLIAVGSAIDQGLVALAGSGAREIGRSSAPGETDAAQVAALAAGRSLPARGSPPPRPLYLRPPDVSLPRAGPRSS